MAQSGSSHKIRLTLLTLVAVFTVLGVGCGGKEPLTAGQFQAAAEESGYEMISLDGEPEDYITSYCIAAECNGAYFIEFAVIDSESNAKALFEVYQKSFSSVQSEVTNQVSAGTAAYSSYTQSAGGQYYYVIRVGQTLACVVAPDEYQEEIVEFMKETGYWQ